MFRGSWVDINALCVYRPAGLKLDSTTNPVATTKRRRADHAGGHDQDGSGFRCSERPFRAIPPARLVLITLNSWYWGALGSGFHDLRVFIEGKPYSYFSVVLADNQLFEGSDRDPRWGRVRASQVAGQAYAEVAWGS